jgi:endonuclease/exonuclease/phosphatase family metal-dependent hydrolase
LTKGTWFTPLRCVGACIAGLSLWPLIAGQAQTKRTDSDAFPPQFNVPREIKTITPVSDLRSIRVMSWNIDRGYHFDRLAETMLHEPADLYLLQEVDWGTSRLEGADVGAELAHRTHLDLSYAIEFEELSQEHGSPAYIGQATLTRLPIRRSRVLRFEHQSGFWKPRSWLPSSLPLMQRRLGNRVALVTDLEFAGQPLVVYNAHLESRSYGRIQMEQLDEMLADLRSNYPPNTAAIIGGDLNTKYLPSIFLHKLEREGFRSSIGERIERSHTIAMALDWIFVRGPVRWESGAVRKDWKGSDHYPIYAELVAAR